MTNSSPTAPAGAAQHAGPSAHNATVRRAGEDYTRARYYDEDDDYLLEREPFVRHADVRLASGMGTTGSS